MAGVAPASRSSFAAAFWLALGSAAWLAFLALLPLAPQLKEQFASLCMNLPDRTMFMLEVLHLLVDFGGIVGILAALLVGGRAILSVSTNAEILRRVGHAVFVVGFCCLILFGSISVGLLIDLPRLEKRRAAELIEMQAMPPETEPSR